MLTNDARELALLVPSHELRRPQIQGAPFSTLLRAERASLAWQGAMETRYFIYSVHTSRTFVHAPTLAARLYLALVRLLTRQYELAATLLAACTHRHRVHGGGALDFRSFWRRGRRHAPGARRSCR